MNIEKGHKSFQYYLLLEQLLQAFLHCQPSYCSKKTTLYMVRNMTKHGVISTYFCFKHQYGKEVGTFLRAVYPYKKHVTTHPAKSFK